MLVLCRSPTSRMSINHAQKTTALRSFFVHENKNHIYFLKETILALNGSTLANFVLKGEQLKSFAHLIVIR